MARPRLSVLIPTPGRPGTLVATLRTCVAQDFDDCEFVVSDNAGDGAVPEAVGGFDDARLRLVRPPKPLTTTDSWEFALEQARGEYVTVIGAGGGLLLHALCEIDGILGLIGGPLLRWELVRYVRPDRLVAPAAPPDELLIPLAQVDTRQSVQLVEARLVMLDVAHSRIAHTRLPGLDAAAVHRRLLDRLRTRTGRVFRSPYPGVYSGFAFAYLAGSYHSCAVPMGLGGRFDADGSPGRHPAVPDLPLRPARVADAFLRAREALFPDDAALALDRRALLVRCLEALGGAGEAELAAAVAAMQESVRDDPALVAWLETSWRAAVPGGPPEPVRRRYGGGYLRLDAAEFGVRDVYEAAVLCERLLGYKVDGLSVHLAPGPRPEPAGRQAGAEGASARLPDREPDLAPLLRLYRWLPERTVVDVGAARGGFAEVLLDEGCPRLWAFEPDPARATTLRERFGRDPRVEVLEVAVGARDEKAELLVEPIDGLAGPGEGRGPARLPVACRSLGSLVDDGTLPADIGVLKVDTGGSDLEVMRGMGRLSPRIVVVESPAVLGEMAAALGARGYANCLLITQHDGFQVLQLGSVATRAGDRGSAIFVHDHLWPDVAPLLQEAVAGAQVRLVGTALDLHRRARRDLAAIEALQAQQARRAQLELSSGRRRWLRPRLGHLRHYLPRPLEIPARYLAEPPVASGPVVSVVTPTLNSERFLERTLRSVLDQGYAPLEYLVKDGGSADGTLALLERYRERLAAVRIGKDTGQADALNQGFREATGELLAYLNGDDLFLPGTLRYVARYFLEHPEVDVVYGHRVLIDADDQEIGRWVLPRHDSRILSWADYVPQETLFWRRRIWERAGSRLDDSFQFAMDWELLLRFRACGARFVRLPRFLGAFRVHEDQKTSARMGDVGLQEMARLRLSVHGRLVTEAEVRRGVWGYLVRHMAYQKLYRAGVLAY